MAVSVSFQSGHIFEEINSLSFPKISRSFSNFSLRNSEENNSLEYISIDNYVTYSTFSLSFPGFFYKNSVFPEILTIFPIP